MNIIVQKYGGTSVGSIDKIRSIAQRISLLHKNGQKVVIVLSAMAGETTRLTELTNQFKDKPDSRFTDILLSTGEQVSISLMAMALEELDIHAIPLLGSQIPIITDDSFSRARIKKIHKDNLLSLLEQNIVPVIAGFQGITEKGEITTLGRGGSDITAVAIASALEADECEIFTDVDGVLTADPRICADSKKLKNLSYEEMLELADAGAKVIHTRAVEIAAKYKVPIHIRSSFHNNHGTWIRPEEKQMEDTLVSGITYNINEAKVAIRQIPDKIGITEKIFKPLAKAKINVDLIIQNISADGFTDLTFTVPKDDLKKTIALTEAVAKDINAKKVEAAGDIAKISVVGLGMRSHAGIAHKMFETLAKEQIGIQMIGTSEIKVSIIIDIKYVELAVKALHKAFNLRE